MKISNLGAVLVATTIAMSAGAGGCGGKNIRLNAIPPIDGYDYSNTSGLDLFVPGAVVAIFTSPPQAYVVCAASTYGGAEVVSNREPVRIDETSKVAIDSMMRADVASFAAQAKLGWDSSMEASSFTPMALKEAVTTKAKSSPACIANLKSFRDDWARRLKRPVQFKLISSAVEASYKVTTSYAGGAGASAGGGDAGTDDAGSGPPASLIADGFKAGLNVEFSGKTVTVTKRQIVAFSTTEFDIDTPPAP